MATGTVELDFGAAPGKTDASIAVASATIAAGSLVEAWLRPVATADHSADEHMVESFRVFAADIVAGVGFTVYGHSTAQWGGQQSHNIYGLWTCAWAWV